jgi:hypothetical protein
MPYCGRFGLKQSSAKADVGPVLSIALLLAVAAWIFFVTLRRVRRVPGQRGRMLAGGIAMLVIGAMCALWLPAQVPETAGSPATTVGIVASWIVGGLFLLLGVPVLLGAVFGASRKVEPPKPG